MVDFNAPAALTVAYRYCRGDVGLILHLKLRRVDGEPCNFCAIFKALLTKTDDRLFGSQWQREVKFPRCDLGHHYMDQSMLVTVIEVSDQGQQRREMSVPSVVRLHSLDSCPHINSQRFDPARREVSSIVEDRKLQLSLVSGGILTSIMNGGGVDKVIQGGSQIVNTVAYHNRPIVKRRRSFDIEDYAVAAAVSVSLSAEDIRFAVHPKPDVGINGLGMFVSPPDFDPATCKLWPGHGMILSTDSKLSADSITERHAA
jgi:hypothetical protein